MRDGSLVKTHAALAEDQGSGPSIHVETQTYL